MELQALHNTSVSPLGGVNSISHSTSHEAAQQGPSPFGPAYVRHSGSVQCDDCATYTAAGRMVGSTEEEQAEERTMRKLEQRDQEVRQREEAKGEAVGDSHYIYQTGPDGERYAIGTSAHAVRPEEETAEAGHGNARSTSGEELSAEEADQLRRLEARDAKVRSHEAAHVMAASGQASMPSYNYQTGPDGRRYAVGGSVNISMMSTGDAEYDARQARTAYRAAMATGEPSGADLTAANRAMEQMMNAKQVSQEDNPYLVA